MTTTGSASHSHDLSEVDAALRALNTRLLTAEATITSQGLALARLEAAAKPPESDVPIGDLPGWRQVFLDTFSTLDPARYSSYPDPWPDTRRKSKAQGGQGDTVNGGVYSGLSRLSVRDGILTVNLGRDAAGVPRSTAFTPLLPGGSAQLYGRYAIRFRSPLRGVGWKTAWLLWPKSETWPRDGEIDFPEGNLTGTINAFMHRQGATSGSDQVGYHTPETFEPWHTAVIEWKPGSCEFLLDGVSIGRTTDRVPNTPMRWVIQSETALDGSIPAADASIQSDWLAVWAYAP